MYLFNQATWLHQPESFIVDKEKIEIITQPYTDFWQRTYYGFQNDNAPALLLQLKNCTLVLL